MAHDSLTLRKSAARDQVSADTFGADATPIAGISTARKVAVIVVGVLVGLVIAVLWSAELVDRQIGETIADGMLGRDARAGAVGSGVAGAVFGFVAGLAGTFTACNVAAFSSVGSVIGSSPSAGTRMRESLRQIGWLSVGVIGIAGLYGAIAAAIGPGIPQLNTDTVGNDMPVRLVQSSIVFTILGLVFLWLGLAAIKVLPDPLRRLSARFPAAPMVVMGALIGGFLIGRPYPLFFKLFQEAANEHNPLFGAASFILTAIGNIVVMAVLFVALAVLMGPRYQRWVAQNPARLATITAVALLIGGAFMLFYWGVRLPAKFDYGWFPRMPWK